MSTNRSNWTIASRGVFNTLALLALVQLGGCPNADNTGLTQGDLTGSGDSVDIAAGADAVVAGVMDELPDLNQEPQYTMSASDGPADALFGYGIDGKKVFPLGRVSADGAEVTGVEVRTIFDEPIMRVEMTDDSLKTTLPEGHSVEVTALADGLRFEFVIETANPPYVLIAETDSAGNLTMAQQAPLGSPKQLSDSSVFRGSGSRKGAARAEARGSSRRAITSVEPELAALASNKATLHAQPFDLSCEALLNDLETGANKLCEIRSLLTSAGPALAVDQVCIGLSNLLDGIVNANDPPQVTQAIAAAKIVMTGLCELVKLGFKATDLSPWGLACTALSTLTNLSVSIDGQTIASRACWLFGFGSDGVGDRTLVTPNDGDDPNEPDGPVVQTGRIQVTGYWNTDCEHGILGDSDFDPSRSQLKVYFEGDTLVIDWPGDLVLHTLTPVYFYNKDTDAEWSVLVGSDERGLITPPIRVSDCADRSEDIICPGETEVPPGNYHADIVLLHAEPAPGGCANSAQLAFTVTE